jgi:23S rRNA (uracil1939-C5)-methyltransferase
MAKYEIQPTVVLQTKWSIEPLATHWKVELPEFEPILGSEKQFSTETKWNFRFNSRWLTEAEIAVLDLGNRNIRISYPKMWDKILDINKCHLEDPSNAIRNEVEFC